MTFTCGINIPSDVKALIFDLDGTLIDNMPLHIQAWKDAGDTFGVIITEDIINQNAGTSTLELINKLIEINKWTINAEEFTKVKQQNYRSLKANAGPIKVVSPIIEIAEYYKDRLPMAIGTGSSKISAMSALEDAGIVSWFKNIVTADDVEFSKPHPEVFMKSANIFDIMPEYCLVFEDGDNGIKSAIAAGMKWIDVRHYL